MATTYKIEMVRSDMGDGGWSLHGVKKNSDPSDLDSYPLLVSGPSSMRKGEWVRPSPADYRRAQSVARRYARERYDLEDDR